MQLLNKNIKKIFTFILIVLSSAILPTHALASGLDSDPTFYSVFLNLDFQWELHRDATPDELQFYMARFPSWNWSDRRALISACDNQKYGIRQYAIDYLGRDASLTPDQAYQYWGLYACGNGMDALKNLFTSSVEMGFHIRDLAISALGRDPGSLSSDQAKAYWGGYIQAGGTFSSLRLAFATSDEAASHIRQLAIDYLGRDPSITPNQAKAYWGDYLIAGGTFQSLKVAFATSDEAGAKIREMAITILGRDPATISIDQARSYWGGFLLAGGTMENLRVAFTNSAEAQAFRARH